MNDCELLLPGFHPDPSICQVGDDSYLVTSSFEFLPGLPIHHSRDLRDWRLVGHGIHRPGQLDYGRCARSQGIWAPCLRHIHGRFALVATFVAQEPWPALFRNFLITADDPAGPWSDPVWLDDGGIDPDLVQDEQGRVWYCQTGAVDGRQGIVMRELDWATQRLLGPRHLLWQGTDQAFTEGPHLYRHDGWWYLLVAEGGTGPGHCVSIARSRSITGPYETAPQQVLDNRGTTHLPQAAGHGDLFQGPDGEWRMVHLGIRHGDACSPLGRETWLSSLRWIDGWPVAGDGGRVRWQDPGKTAEERQLPVQDPSWCTFRAWPAQWLRLESQTHHLRPGPALDRPDGSPSWRGVRQQHLECLFSALVAAPVAGALQAPTEHVWMILQFVHAGGDIAIDIGVGGHAVAMRILARQHRCPSRGAGRGGAVGGLETAAAGGQLVQVGGLTDAPAIATEGIEVVLIGHDQEHVQGLGHESSPVADDHHCRHTCRRNGGDD